MLDTIYKIQVLTMCYYTENNVYTNINFHAPVLTCNKRSYSLYKAKTSKKFRTVRPLKYFLRWLLPVIPNILLECFKHAQARCVGAKKAFLTEAFVSLWHQLVYNVNSRWTVGINILMCQCLLVKALYDMCSNTYLCEKWNKQELYVDCCYIILQINNNLFQ